MKLTRLLVLPAVLGCLLTPSPSPLAGAVSAEKIILLPVSGATREDTEIARWQERARDPKATAGYFERLGWAFIAKARRTQDAGFYKLAEATALAMDARFGPGEDGRLLRAHALHNLHRFAEAEAVARELVAMRGLAWDHALLSDVLMEQGKIDDAVESLQQAMNLRPGVEAYARAAHLRWLRGDLDGAVAAMTEALLAGSPRDAETAAWALTRLSGYRLQQGQLEVSRQLAEAAQKKLPDYPPALLAVARAALARGDVASAVAAADKAAELNPLPEYQWWQAEALRAGGDAAGADRVEAGIVRHGEAADGRTLAVFLATRGLEPQRALALALQEMETRNDVFTFDAIAWAQLASGQIDAADESMKRALFEKTQDARLFLHAGIIAAAKDGASSARALAHFESAKRLQSSLTPSEREQLSARIAESHAPASAPKPSGPNVVSRR